MHYPLLLTTEPFHKVMIGGRGVMMAPLITCSLSNCAEEHTWYARPDCLGLKDHRPSLTWHGRNCGWCSFEPAFFWFTRITRRYNRFCLSGTRRDDSSCGVAMFGQYRVGLALNVCTSITRVLRYWKCQGESKTINISCIGWERFEKLLNIVKIWEEFG